MFAAFIYLTVWRMIQIHHVPCCWSCLTNFTAKPKTTPIPYRILTTTTFLPLQKIHKLAREPNLLCYFKSRNHHLRPSPYSFIRHLHDKKQNTKQWPSSKSNLHHLFSIQYANSLTQTQTILTSIIIRSTTEHNTNKSGE